MAARRWRLSQGWIQEQMKGGDAFFDDELVDQDVEGVAELLEGVSGKMNSLSRGRGWGLE